LSLDTHFEFSPATSISPAPDPARYKTEKAIQKIEGVIGFTSSPKRLTHPEDPAAALAGTLARYTGHAPMDHGVGKISISADERVKSFVATCCV